MTYEAIKTKLTEHKNTAILAVAFIGVFGLGYGTGSGVTANTKVKNNQQNQINYNTLQKNSPQTTNDTTTAEADVTPPAQAPIAADAKCVVKGNISSKGKKIYHMVGGAFYTTVKPEQCFATEAEALKAGFKKSGR